MKCFNSDLVNHQKICTTEAYTHKEPDRATASAMAEVVDKAKASDFQKTPKRSPHHKKSDKSSSSVSDFPALPKRSPHHKMSEESLSPEKKSSKPEISDSAPCPSRTTNRSPPDARYARGTERDRNAQRAKQENLKMLSDWMSVPVQLAVRLVTVHAVVLVKVPLCESVELVIIYGTVTIVAGIDHCRHL